MEYIQNINIDISFYLADDTTLDIKEVRDKIEKVLEYNDYSLDVDVIDKETIQVSGTVENDVEVLTDEFEMEYTRNEIDLDEYIKDLIRLVESSESEIVDHDDESESEIVAYV